MAIKNLFGRGIGFGGPHWIVTRGYAGGAVAAVGRVLDKVRSKILAKILDKTL